MENFQNSLCFFSYKRFRFNLSSDRHPNKLPQSLPSSVLEHRNKFSALENGKKLILITSVTLWILEGLKYKKNFSSMVLKWDTGGFDY